MKRVIGIILLFVTVLASAQSYKRISYLPTEEQRLNDLYCTGLFKSAEGTILNVEAQPGISAYFNILDWLEGRVAGLQVYNTRTGIRVPIIRGNRPGIYLDEMPISADQVRNINTIDIAIVKVIRQPFLGGFNGSGGAIAIYTKMGEEEEE